MHRLKEKVTEKFSRIFPDSTNSSSSPSSPSSASQNQARSYSKGGKSLTSYFSHIIPSIGFDGSGSDKNPHEFKLIPSLPLRYSNRNSKRHDELVSYTPPSDTSHEKNETQNNHSKDDIIDDKASGASTSSSDEFEEAIDQHSPQKKPYLPNLMDESVFISPDLYEFLFSSIPNIVKGCQWVLLYSTLKHGISLRTLIRRSADLSGPCLLIVGDKQGAVFGGLLDCPLTPTAKRKFQGTNQTFVFTTIYGEPRLFRPTGANRYYYLCLDDLLALGGGGNFALCLDGDLLNGTSGPCETFGNMCLAHKPEFELKNVELWAFTHASQYLT